jgi:multiple sugar transport system substrate-binding protein
MKKAITILLTLLLLLSAATMVFAGGGQEEQAEEEAQAEEGEVEYIEPFHLQKGKPYDGTQLNFLICCPTAGQFAAMQKKSNEEFTELTGIKVDWGEVPYGSFQQKLMTEATSASGTYDLFAYTDAWGAGLNNYMVPLEDKIQEVPHLKDMAAYPDAYVRACMGVNQEHLYGIPLRGHPFMFFYRKDIYNDVGIEAPETWSEMENNFSKIKSQKDIWPISAYYGINAGQNLFLWEAYLWSNGGNIFDENYKPVFNNEAGVEATERYMKLLRDGFTRPGSTSYNEQEANEEMIKGRSASFIGWWWMYSRLTDCERTAENVCENIGFAPAPKWEGKGDPATYAHVWPMGINKYSDDKDAAWEYLKWLHHPSVSKDIVTDKSDPKYNTNVAVRMDVLTDPEVNEANNGLPKVGAEILENAKTQPIIPEWLEVMGVLEVAINDIATGADLESTLDTAAQDVEDIMERSGYYD